MHTPHCVDTLPTFFQRSPSVPRRFIIRVLPQKMRNERLKTVEFLFEYSGVGQPIEKTWTSQK